MRPLRQLQVEDEPKHVGSPAQVETATDVKCRTQTKMVEVNPNRMLTLDRGRSARVAKNGPSARKERKHHLEGPMDLGD